MRKTSVLTGLGALLSINLVAQLPAYVPTNGLISWYSFNGNANDLSTNGNHGSNHGATSTADRFGNANAAYYFNGGSYIDFGPVTQFLATEPFTVSAWFQIPASSTNTDNSFLYRGDWQEMNQFGFNFGGSPTKPKLIMRVAGQTQYVECVSTVNDGAWHFAVWTHDGSGLIKIYIDGAPTVSSTVTNLANHSFNLILGRLGDTDNHTYTGYGDDIGIWGRELTQPEIDGLFGVSDTCFYTVYTSVTDTLVINAQLTGISEPNNVNTIKVYPNPTNTHIYIDNGNYTSMNGYTAKILNSIGQEMFSQFINQQTFYIDLSSWTGTGLYFLHIIDNQGNTIEVKKIILQ